MNAVRWGSQVETPPWPPLQGGAARTVRRTVACEPLDGAQSMTNARVSAAHPQPRMVEMTFAYGLSSPLIGMNNTFNLNAPEGCVAPASLIAPY